jgi:T-complex protein 1 subunit eta
LATQYFADRNIFCAGRVSKEDMRRVEKATGARILTTLSDLRQEQLGTCELFEEKRVGASRYNFFTGCPASKTATLILRGGAE